MRILGITHQYPRLGNELFAPFNRHQIRCLAQRHSTRLIVPISWTQLLRGGYTSYLGRPRCYRNRDGLWVEHPTFFFTPRVLSHTYGACYVASIRRSTERTIAGFRPDIIFSAWSHPDGWAAVQIARKYRLPVVVKVVGSDVLILSRDVRRRARVAEGLSRADAVVAVSHDLAENVRQLGVDPGRIKVIPEGIDQTLFCPGIPAEARARLGIEQRSDSPSRLLFVGNLLFSKGAGVLIEACALLRERQPSFRCHLVGKGADEPALRALCSRLGVQSIVEFVGPRPQSQLPDWYRACDLVVLPSFSEGIPNVLREAMMCGRAFVATRVGGIPEITRPSVGRLVDPGDPPQLADAIDAALRDNLVADRATALELNITWEQSADRLAAVLQDALAGSRPGAYVGGIRRISRRNHSPGTTPVAAKPPTDPKLRILTMTQVFPRPSAKTVGAFNINQFLALATRYPLAVIAPVPWTDVFTRQRHRARSFLQEVDKGLSVRRPTFYFTPRFLHVRSGLFYLASVRRCFENLVSQFKPNVVLGCWSHPDGWAAVRLARENGIPVVIKVHGSDVLVLVKNRRRRTRVAEALREADVVIAVSQDLADHVVALGVDPARVHVIPHGVDVQGFSPGDPIEAKRRIGWTPANENGAPIYRLLFVGNLLFSKGAGVLIEACALLRGRQPSFRCHLVGKGADEPALRALCSRLGVHSIVEFVGPRPQSQLPDWYRACDLVVLPSFSEGIPNVLREAMMCGRAFVATRVGGIPEITRPSVGRLVDPGDPRQLADAIDAALRDNLVADRATALELNITWEQSADHLAAVLEDAIRRYH